MKRTIKEYDFSKSQDVEDFLNNEEEALEHIELFSSSNFNFITRVNGKEKDCFQLWYLEKYDIYALHISEYDKQYKYFFTRWSCDQLKINKFIEDFNISRN